MSDNHQDIATAEKEAVDSFVSYISGNAELLSLVARWGDGRCGYLAELMADILCGQEKQYEKRNSRPEISAKKRTTVYERDAYRCKLCDGYNDLTIDHIKPLCAGGSNSINNLQTLCRSCNSKKGVSI